MTPEEFKKALLELKWSQSEFGRKAGLTPTTVSRWATGETEVPRWADSYLGLALEVQRLHAQYIEPKGTGRK
jgi:transcriptional regulator with XRE-family HTH domain